MAYPGSPLYERAVRQGVPLPSGWTGYSQHSRDCLPLPTRHLAAREVLAFRDAAFTSYYTNPHYLDMVGRRFGREMVQHIRRMTDVPLERDLLSGKMRISPMMLPTEEVEQTGRRTALAVSP
jgi:hypothetical protein